MLPVGLFSFVQSGGQGPKGSDGRWVEDERDGEPDEQHEGQEWGDFTEEVEEKVYRPVDQLTEEPEGAV
jgi:hypothetical protein